MKTLLTAAAIVVLTPIVLLVKTWDDLCIRYDDNIEEEADRG